MPEEITVTYDGKAFHPEKTLNLEPNTRYTIQIISTQETVETTEKNAWDLLEEMAGTYPAEEDWSTEHDHYLYGAPKRNDTDKYR